MAGTGAGICWALSPCPAPRQMLYLPDRIQASRQPVTLGQLLSHFTAMEAEVQKAGPLALAGHAAKKPDSADFSSGAGKEGG